MGPTGFEPVVLACPPVPYRLATGPRSRIVKVLFLLQNSGSGTGFRTRQLIIREAVNPRCESVGAKAGREESNLAEPRPRNFRFRRRFLLNNTCSPKVALLKYNQKRRRGAAEGI